MKKQLEINVYEAAKQRIEWVFDKFNKIYVCFSAGKDSTCMLHMAMDEAIKRNRKIGVLLIDLEGQYDMTIDHAMKCREMYRDYADWYWVCLPIHLRNAVSSYEPFWKCWDKTAEKEWVRPMPKDCISDYGFFPFFRDGMEFEEFAPMFGEWYADGEECACLVGIRADESLNRYRTIANRNKTRKEGKPWTTKVTDSVYNIYPIYDWQTQDDWIYQGKHPEKPYNRIYDYMYLAGVSIHQMRICQPYGDDQKQGLWLFHILEPQTWAKVVQRVSGANSGALYVRQSGNVSGYRHISKPEGHTWKSFCDLLLKSMPQKSYCHYNEMISKYVSEWEEKCYFDGIPDEANLMVEKKKDVPSWRKICKCLLKNDFWLRGLNYAPQKSEAYHEIMKLVKRKQNADDRQISLWG